MLYLTFRGPLIVLHKINTTFTQVSHMSQRSPVRKKWGPIHTLCSRTHIPGCVLLRAAHRADHSPEWAKEAHVPNFGTEPGTFDNVCFAAIFAWKKKKSTAVGVAFKK